MLKLYALTKFFFNTALVKAVNQCSTTVYLMYLILRKAITERQKLGSRMYMVDHEHRAVIIDWFFIIVPSFLDSKSSWRLSLMSVTCVPESESAIDIFLLSVKHDIKIPFTHLENSLNDHRFSWSFTSK